MSTTSSFIFRRAFPFCESEAPAIPPDEFYSWPSVALSGAGGGLAEAMRLWWSLESLQFVYGADEAVFTIPQDAESEFPDKVIGGSIVAADSATTVGAGAISAAHPVSRACFGPGGWSEYATIIYLSAPGIVVRLILGNDAGAWRLYYSYAFEDAAADSVVLNPEASDSYESMGWSVVDSGNFSLFGYTLPWECWANPFSSVTTGGLSSTATFFTYT